VLPGTLNPTLKITSSQPPQPSIIQQSKKFSLS